MNWNQIISFFVTTSTITLGIVYILKLLIDKFAESRIEKYKSSLQTDTENFKHRLSLEAEKFRNELSISSIEHQIVYSKLYEERGHIIKKIYGLLLELELSLMNLTTVFQGAEWTTDTERDKKANESINTLRRELEINRLYFSDDLCKRIESILDESHQITVEMFVAKKKEQRIENSIRRNIDLKPEELTASLDKWTELDDKVKKEIKSARVQSVNRRKIKPTSNHAMLTPYCYDRKGPSRAAFHLHNAT